MSAISAVTADWLALRGGADDAARSRALAGEVAARLRPGPVVVHDLGSGTGAMLRWLAPQLPGPQRWVLHDGDAAILAQGESEGVTDAAGGSVAVRTSTEPLAELESGALVGAALVTASALLDVITLHEAAAIVAACTRAAAPAFFSLTVTGEVRLDPVDPLDLPVQFAFNDHQRRIAARRRLLGPDAFDVVSHLFAAVGWTVRCAPTPWRLGAASGELVAGWLRGWVGAAVEQLPELDGQADDYLRRRTAQLAEGRLRVEVQHADLAAWPA